MDPQTISLRMGFKAYGRMLGAVISFHRKNKVGGKKWENLIHFCRISLRT